MEKKMLNVAWLNGEMLNANKLNVFGGKFKRNQGNSDGGEDNPIQENSWLWNNGDTLCWDDGSLILTDE